MALPIGVKALGSFKGAKGDTGPSNTLRVGTVETVTDLSQAAAWLEGVSPNQILNLRVPRGLPAPGAALTDEAIAAFMSTLGTDTNSALGSEIQKYTSEITVEASAQSGDASDDISWARAISTAETFGIRHVRGTRGDYYFAAPVSLDGINGITISGAGRDFTSIHPKVGAGIIEAAFLISTGGEDASKIIIRDIGIDGGMTNGESLGDAFARDERTYTTDRFSRGILVFGDKVPGVGALYPTVTDVAVLDCSFYGIESLPVFVGGVGGSVVMSGCHVERCLDSGFVFNDSVQFNNNVVRYSADNGVSLSRGNRSVVAVGNTIYGSHRYGVWLGGFPASPGAGGIEIPAWGGSYDATVTGNVILKSGVGGIYAMDAPKNVTISANLIRDVRRGAYENTDEYGIGIWVRGLGPTPAAPEEYAENINITGNVLIDCRRGGVGVLWGVRGLVVANNIFVNMGMANDVSGSPVSANGGYFNFAIACPGAGLAASNPHQSVSNVLTAGNLVYDTRSPSPLKHGTYHNRVIPTWTDRGNVVYGAAIAYLEILPETTFERYVNVGTSSTNDVQLRFRTAASGVGATLLWQEAGSPKYSMYTDPANGLMRFAVYPGGTRTTAWSVDATSAQTTFSVAPRIPRVTTANRPTAASAGNGAIILDQSLNKLLFSNGVEWRDAMGVVV